MAPRVRLELVADFGPRRGQTFSSVVVEPSYEAILRAGLNKLKLKKRHDLLLVLRDRYQGVRALDRAADLGAILRDGATVVLTTERPALRLPRPPRWPWPGGSAEALEELGRGDDESARVEDIGAPGDALQGEPPPSLSSPPKCDAAAGQAVSGSDFETDVLALLAGESLPGEHAPLGEWSGPWPVLDGNVLPLLREATARVPGFLEKDLGAYLAFDYHAANAGDLPAMFPDPRLLPRKGRERLLASVRRECRGLLVCSASGAVLARRLPKFFNIDELEETRAECLPQGGVATGKLDGSLVSPFLLEGEVRWAGKSAIWPAVESFAAQLPSVQRVAELVRHGHTPIFEWCQEGPPVGVVGHAESRLVLLAVRNTITGDFWPDGRLRTLGCEVADRVPFRDLPDLLSVTRLRLGVEGVVVAWPELGCMVKLKTQWWTTMAAAQKHGTGSAALAFHSALQTLPLSSIPPRLVWQAVLTADDDQMSLLYGSLTPSEQESLRSFSRAVQQGIQTLHHDLQEWAECARDATEADLSSAAGGWPLTVLVAYQRRAPLAERGLRKFLTKMAVVGQLPGLEGIVGTSWDGSRQTNEFLGHLGTFEEAPQHLVDHVLHTYLPRKMGEYLGRAVEEDTPVRVERLYEPSEGKIKGLWEQFVSEGIIDLRVDLQPRGRVLDFHGGDVDFAHWQVQFGPNDNCPRSTKERDGDRRGAFAGVLLRTGVDVEFRQLREALALSFGSRKVVRIDPSPSRPSHVYVDLDGVLVDFEAGFEEDFGGLPEPRVRWQHIEKTAGFYESLPWMAGGRRLWDHVRQTGLPITVLTGVPEGSLGRRSAEEKAAWVARELGSVEIITCLSREKPLHSGPGRLLIDDRPQKGWETAGGRQIVHHSVPDTLLALVELGLGRHFVAPRERISLVCTVTDDLRAAREKAEVVGVDVEWPPDRSGAPPSTATVLQLAFWPSPAWAVFVVDMLAWDEELEAFARDLLGGDLPKLVFGQADAERLQMQVSAATDLQEGSCSLAAQARRAGLLLQKSKQLQASDWSARPLRDEQIVYAATDALVLLELGGELGGGNAAKRPQQPHRGGRNVTVEYAGIFLTPDSRKKLLCLVPPRLAEVTADHMTLSWRPESVKGLAVGSSVKLRVEGAGFDDRVQAVSVATVEAEPRAGRVTVSHRQDVAAVEAGELSFAPIDSFVVEGVIGVGVVLGGADEQALPEQVLERLRALAASLPGQSERFEQLTDSQRYAIHLLADELGLEHRSEGRKGTHSRRLVLTVPRRRREKPPSRRPQGERLVVKDSRKFAALFGDVPGLHLHGRLTRGGIVWEPGVTIPPVPGRGTVPPVGEGAVGAERLAVVLRGFPGSGKSSLAARLGSQLRAEVVSADDFWTGPEHLQAAHEQCRQLFVEALTGQRSVVVDNVNARASDYAFYRGRAEAARYKVVVLEIVCDSTAELELLRKRSVHDVPGSAVGAMWSRWEHDPAAWRLAPYLPQELMPWLREQNMVGHPPYTHLVMPSGPFLSVPAAARREFHERFAAEPGRHYISEQARPEAFQLFFDVDRLSLGDLLPALPALRALVGSPLVVTGTAEAPPGHHVFVPGNVVSVAEALGLRRRWIEEQPFLEQHVDAEIYTGGKQSFLRGGGCPHLRLLGSRKISKEGADLGRVHSVLGRYDAAWQEDPPWDWSNVSIRA